MRLTESPFIELPDNADNGLDNKRIIFGRDENGL